MSKIAILGGGSWGTGLAVVLAHSRRRHEIRTGWRESTIAQGIQENRENPVYLPGVPLPECIQASTEIGEVLHEAQIVLGAVPSAFAREVFSQALAHISIDAVIVSATKG